MFCPSPRAGRRIVMAALTMLAVSAFTSCSGGGGGGTDKLPPSLNTISVTPVLPSVVAGLTQQFAAKGTYSDGSTADITSSVTWSSGTTSVATINSAGLATSKTPGSSLITATSGAISGSTTLTATGPTLLSISVTPDLPSVAAGLTQQFAAKGIYSNGSNADITSSVTWSSGTTSVATVNASGLATSKTQGSSLISATLGTIIGSTTLTVTAPQLVSTSISPANETAMIGTVLPKQFSVIETYTDQSTKNISSGFTWTVANPYVASIGSTGAAQPLRTGYTAITATKGALSLSAGFAVLATPRYLYVSSLAGRYLTRMGVNSTSGQPRFLGDQATDGFSSVGSTCLTTDPDGKHVYQTGQTSSSSGILNIYAVDEARGKLTPYAGNPYQISVPIGCINFEPSGKFAYATSGIDNDGNVLATFSVNSDGTLALVNSISLPDQPGDVAIDPLGRFLWVSGQYITVGQSTYAYGYTIDPTTGGLTPIPGTPMLQPAESDGAFTFHPSGNYMYLSDACGTSVREYAIDRSSGQLSPVSSATVNPCINPSPVEFSPDGSHAYLSCDEDINRSLKNAPIVSFSVGADGQLTQIGTAFAGIIPGQMVVDPSGKFVYLRSSGSDYLSTGPGSYTGSSNVVMVYQVGMDGTLTLVNQIAGRDQESSLLLVGGANPVTWASNFAYVTSLGDEKLTSYSIQTDGSLSSLQSRSTAAAPIASAMLPWGSDLLVAGSAAAPNMTAYAVSNGVLSVGSSIGESAHPAGLVMDPSGLMAFETDSSSGSVDEYYYGDIPGAWMNAAGGPVFTAQAGAGPIVTDPSGRFLIVANQTAKSISLFEIESSTPISPTSLSYAPLAIVMDPTGNYLFVCGDDNELHMLVSNGLGTLTESGHPLLPGNATSVAVEPTGHFVYAAGAAGLSAFSINSQTQVLAPVTLNLPVSLTSANGVYIDPSGRFLYVSVSSSKLNALYLFTINEDGTLSSTSSAPVATPNHATSMVFSAQIQ